MKVNGDLRMQFKVDELITQLSSCSAGSRFKSGPGSQMSHSYYMRLYVTWFSKCRDEDRSSFHSTPCRPY